MKAPHSFFAVWHPDHGYLVFRSYNTVTAYDYPHPKSLYTKRKDAEYRTGSSVTKGGYCLTGRNDRVMPSDLEIVEITLTMEVQG